MSGRSIGIEGAIPLRSLDGVPPNMPHIHDKIDFTVAIFVVHEGRVLVIHHRKLDRWLPLGGHIELDEDPEQAALRDWHGRRRGSSRTSPSLPGRGFGTSRSPRQRVRFQGLPISSSCPQR